ncbi:MAG: HdaA/DnaA family protein [Alphaproteobacteria bacterium]
MPKQFNLGIEKPADYSIDNFYVGEGEISPLEVVLKPKSWSNNILIISGDAGSGKTHLSHIYAEKFKVPLVDNNVLHFDMLENIAKSGCVIDDIENVDEQLLFHLINLAIEYNGNVVFTTSSKIMDMNIKLPDLKSRLLQAMIYVIPRPSDDGLRFVLLKNVMDRELNIKSNVMSYIIDRMPRSYKKVNDLVKLLDEESMARSSEISTAFVRTILSENNL